MTDTYRVVITPTIADDRGIVFNTLENMFSGWDMSNVWFYVQSRQKAPDNPVSEWLSQKSCNKGATYDNLGTLITQIKTDILLFDSLVAFDPGDNNALENLIAYSNGKASILRVLLQRNKLASNEPVKTKPLIPVDVNFDIEEPSWYNEKQKIQHSWRHVIGANDGFITIHSSGGGGANISSSVSVSPYVQPMIDMGATAAEEKAMALMEYEKHMEEVKQEYDDKLSKLLMDSVNQAMAESEVPIAPAPGTDPKKPWWKF